MAIMAYTMDNFESQKNMKASAYTLAICVALVLLLLFITWTLPLPPPIPQEDGIEVNLGNSDKGLGTDQPYLPGKPSAQDQQKYTPPKVAAVVKEAVKDVETNDNEKEEAPVVKKPPVTKPDATKIEQKDITPKVVKITKPAENPAPVKPKPKAVFNGVSGTGNGGNDADSYKPGGNQGIAGGKGDQGQPGGNPNSNNYTGPGGNGNSGLKISKGLEGRYFVKTYKYEGDFNESGFVAVDVLIDKSGNVLNATFQSRGSTLAESFYREKAIEIIKKSKLNANPNGPDEQSGTIIVKFSVK